MKEDELPFITEHPDVAPLATMVFSCLNKQIQSFPIYNTFLVGTVTGCELRLAGLDLPALLFQLNYVKQKGLLVRSITPLSGLTLNGASFQESILKSNDKLNIGNYEFSFILADSLTVTSPIENSLPKFKDKLTARNKIKGKVKNKRFLSRLIKKLKNKIDLLKTDLSSLTENNRTISEREFNLLSQQSILLTEKSSVDDQLNLQIIKNKTYSKEIEQLRGEIEALKNADSKKQSASDSDLKTITELHELLDKKTQNLHERALEVDRRNEELEKNSRELETQALEIDSLYCKLKEDRRLFEEECYLKNQEHENATKNAAEIEQQMTEIFQLKLYLEKVKSRLEEKEAALEKKILSLQSFETDLIIKQENFDKSKAELVKQEAILSSELQLINQEKEAIQNNKLYIDGRILEIEQKECSLKELEASFATRENKIEADRKSLEDARKEIEDIQSYQDSKIKQADSTEKNLAQMQEILRKRIEDIQLKESALNEKDILLSNQIISLQTRNEEMEQEHSSLVMQLTAARDEFEKSKEELIKKTNDIDSVKFRMEAENHGHELIKKEIFEALQRLEEEKNTLEVIQNSNLEIEKHKLSQEIDLKNEIISLSENMPELMAGAENCLSRLLGARDLLQEHLKEFHDYAKIAREELELLLKESHDQQNRALETESKIIKAREEHRLSIASFKQQLIEWQHNLIGIKLALQSGESELERKQAKFETQAQILQQQSENLSKKETTLREKEGEVLAQSKEVQRHLEEMRIWYRNKIKDLSGLPSSSLTSGYFDNSSVGTPDLKQHLSTHQQAISEIIEPSDKKIGDQLISLGLVDSETLVTLITEAKKSRKSLRQALLNGGYLTFYQMALIEAGNINGLMIDRFRVIDKLPSTSKEHIFQVFDPIKKSECILRHLSESELSDPFHPDEFRQRFSAAINLSHENVVSTYEVMEIQGRPAVLLEFTQGINQSDWISFQKKPDVWLNLVLQTISGLASIHGAGLVYGTIHESSLIMTKEGIIKWTGTGCPTWLVSMESNEAHSVDTDITNLAIEVLKWWHNHGEKQLLRLTMDNSFSDYIKFVEEIAAGKQHVNLNEWLIKTAEELQKKAGWESNYADFIKMNLSENLGQTLKLSA